MRWEDEAREILRQYAHTRTNQLFPDAVDDFTKVVKCAPRQTIANGLAAVLRAEEAPAFAQIVVELFDHSNLLQRAGLLNVLVPYVSRDSQNVLADGGLLGFEADEKHILAHRMMQVSSEAVLLLASEAERRQRSGAIAAVSAFYGEHPAILGHLSAGKLARIMTSIVDAL